MPAQEQYLPRLGPRSIYHACRLLAEDGKPVPLASLANHLNLSTQSTYNVVHEMRMLGLAKVADEAITLNLGQIGEKELSRSFTQHIGEKLRRNRLVQYLLDALKNKAEMPLKEVAELLREKCPYISASLNTWEVYGEVFCNWLEAGGLAIYDKRKKLLLQFAPDQHLTQRPLAATRRRAGGTQVLQVHYTPVETLALAFVQYLKARKFEWPEMKPSTREKSLTTLEDFGFVVRGAGPLRLTAAMNTFLSNEIDPSAILGEAALQIPSFKEFINILESRSSAKCSLLQLGDDLRTRMNADWKDGTAQTTAKILLDWARHTGLAPGVFAQPLRKTKDASADSSQTQLF